MALPYFLLFYLRFCDFRIKVPLFSHILLVLFQNFHHATFALRKILGERVIFAVKSVVDRLIFGNRTVDDVLDLLELL